MKYKDNSNQPASPGQLKQLGFMLAARARKLGISNREIQGCIISGPILSEILDATLVHLLLNPKIRRAALKKEIICAPGYGYGSCDPIHVTCKAAKDEG